MKFEVTLLFPNFSEIEMSRTLLSASNDPRGGLRLWPLYFLLSVIAASTNFLPLIADQTEPCKVPMSSCYLLVICFLLSLPLVFELMLDVFVSMASSSAHFFKEPKIGYGLIIASLFLPVLVVNPGLEGATSLHSVLFINCFVSFLQSLVVIAQYYELQYSTSQHWTVQGSLVVLLFFVASLVCNNFGVACSPMDMIKTPWLMWFRGVALLCSLISFVLHSYLSKRYLVDFLRSKYLNKAITKAWTTDDFVAVVLQCITSIYFAINIVNCVLSLLMHNTTRHLNAVVLSHIVLGLCAAILPGRVVQKNFILLSEKMAIKDTFIRYVSHEIRSPLSTTSLGLNFLLNKLHAGDFTSSELLDVVQESVVTCELAMNTLNDFLMLDKIQSNMLEITPTTCQVSEFMVEAIRPFALQATSANVSLICNVESFDGEVGREVSVEMDCYKMNQVLRNLLSNAFKFTPSGGSITVTMTIREYSNKDLNDQTLLHAVDGRCNTVKIAVNDTGCGISAENLPKLFGQYVQFDAAKLQGGKGSGLGLWLSKAIVEMHGGRMGAKSEGEGKGCTFWFELPCGMSEMVNTNELSQGSSFVTRSFSLSRSAVNDCDSEGGASTKAAESTKSADHDIGANRFPLIRYSSFAMPTLFSTQKPTAQAGSIGSSKIYVDLEVDIPASLRRTASKYKIAFESITAADEGEDSQSFRKPLRVLLVDDSLIARKMVERSLASIEAVCSHASNGLEAVEKVRQSLKSEDDVESHIGGFDVILMDHCMPEMNGPEAVEVIRSLGYKGVIMGVSGYASTDTEFEVLLAAKKIDKMMVKPFNLNVFVDYISSSD